MLGKAEDYAIFVDDDSGTFWKAFVADFEAAKAKARQIAIDDGVEMFVQFQGFQRSGAVLPETEGGNTKGLTILLMVQASNEAAARSVNIL
jgi:hypothetical protein